MTDHKEEQELELEALNSIYPEEFSREYQSYQSLVIASFASDIANFGIFNRKVFLNSCEGCCVWSSFNLSYLVLTRNAYIVNSDNPYSLYIVLKLKLLTVIITRLSLSD